MKPKGAPPRFEVASPRGRGRPLGTTRVNEPRKSVSSWLPASEHDLLIRAANAAEEPSLSRAIREGIKLYIINVLPSPTARSG